MNSSDTGEMRRQAVHFEKERGVTEIRILRSVAHVAVNLEPTDIGSGRLKVLQSLAASSVPVFLVKLLPDGLSFAIRGESVDSCKTALEQTEVPFKLIPDLSVITTIAGAMRDLSGIMAAIYQTLNHAGIRVQQTGDAYNAVLCLVDGRLSDKAAQALRKKFSLDDSGEFEPVREAEVPGAGLKAL
ncbi:MAG: ACT domain-containing protein [Armatimonadota bacterium]